MKQSIWKKLTSLLLVAALLCSFGVTALAEPGDPQPAAPTDDSVTVNIDGDEKVHGPSSTGIYSASAVAAPVEGWTAGDISYKWSNGSTDTVAAYMIDGPTEISVTATVAYTKDGDATTEVLVSGSATMSVKLFYEVTATSGEGYTVTAEPSGEVDAGATVNVSVAANKGYQLVPGYQIDPGEKFTVTADQNVTVKPAAGKTVVEKKSLTVNYILLPMEGITQTAPAAAAVQYGEAVSFPTMTAKVENTNYHVDWFVNGTKAAGLTAEQVNAAIEAGTAAVTVTGQWVEEEATEFTVTLPASGSNYTVAQTSAVPASGKYPKGSVVTFTVTAAKGYKFANGFGAKVNSATSLTPAISGGVASFSYTVGEENAAISLNGNVEPVTLSIAFDMNLTNGGKLRNNGTAKPALVSPVSVKFDAIAAVTPVSAATLTAKAVDGGQTYDLKGWTASGASYGLSLSAAELRAMVTAAKNPNADVNVTLTASWDSALQISAVLDFNVQTLGMSDTTSETTTSLYNQLSKGVTKDASYIKFTNLPTSRYAYGTLYEDSDMKSAVDTKTEYYLGASSQRYNTFADIVFEPAKDTKNDDFIAQFDVFDSKGNVLDSGTLTINTGDEADIVWEMGGDSSIQFNEEDFDKFYSSRTIQLDSVTFEPLFSFGKTEGYVCYGGTDTNKRLTERTFKNGEYYYDNSNTKFDSLSELYYTVGSDDTGYRVFNFTCADEKGRNQESGVLVIKLDGSSSKAASLDLAYNVKYNDTLTLDEGDFYTWAGKNLSYVIFDVSDARGEFTVGTGKNADVLGDDLDDDTEFYYNSSSKRDLNISDVVYTPYSKSNRYTQYVDQIPFKAYSSNGRELKEGTLTICVVADAVPQVTISVDKGKTANFVPADFKTVAGKAVNSSTGIDGVVLTSLPSTGTIYTGTGNTKASTGTTYSLDTKGSNLVSNLRYTATNKDGRYTAAYAAYDGKELLYVGEILFDVGDHAINAGSIYAVGAALPVSTLVKQAEEVLEKDFSYITIAQPSNAIVYYNYKYINSNGGAANSSTKYYYKATGSQQSMASLTVVPYADRTSGESIDLVVTCFDEKDNETKLTVRYTYATASSAGFSDATAAWYKDSIYFLSNNKIVNGVSSTQYGVGTNIKRGDFILMLYRAFNLGSLTSQSSSFVDVKSSDYYAAAIGTAKALGITNGYEVNGQYYFYPEKSITREEAFALIYRTLTLSGVKSQMANSLPTASSSSLSSFRDGSSVQGYAQTAVAVLVKAQIVKGSDGKINPTNPISREEMAVILHRALTRY